MTAVGIPATAQQLAALVQEGEGLPHRDTLGLRSFVEKTHYNAPFAVLVTMLEDVEIPDPRIVPVSLRSLLLAR